MRQPIDFRVLGPLEAYADGRPLALGGGKQRALLAILLLRATEVVPAESLIDALWGERPPASAPNSVHVYVSNLRKEFGEGRLVTRPGGYALELDDDELDARRFERLLSEGRALRAAGEHAAAVQVLAEALALWHGPPLEDLRYEQFAQTSIAHLEELRLLAVEERIEAELELGHAEAVVPELERLVREHSLRERLRAQLMLALYRSGRQGDALEAYRDARTTLSQELGLEPSRTLQELERAILSQEPALERAVPRPLVSAALGRRTPLAIAVAAALILSALGVVVYEETRSGGTAGLAAVPPNAVGVIDPATNRIVAEVPTGSRPTGMAASRGAIWVTNGSAGTVSRIDPESSAVVDSIEVGAGPAGIAAGEGGIWVANSESRTVSEINPDTNKVVQSVAVGNAPRGIAVGEQAVWVANSLDGTVSRIVPTTGRTTTTVVGGIPVAVCVGSGSVWVALEDSGRLVRIDPRSREVTGTTSVGNGPAAVACGSVVWVANAIDGTVSQVDPQTGAVTATVRIGKHPAGIALGGGDVWVADAFGQALVRLDVSAARVDRTIPIGSSPQSLAVSGGRTWIAAVASPSSHRGGTLVVEAFPVFTRIDPALSYDPIGWELLANVYDGLVGFRRVGGAAGATLVADLAKAVPVPSANGRTYRFELRPGLRYANGAPVLARDLRHALERSLALQARPPWSSVFPPFYDGIAGAAQCRRHPDRCDLSKGIVTDDEARTVTFHLNEPDVDFLPKLALPPAAAVPSSTPARDLSAQPPPGTGPYRIAPHPTARKLRLVRNARFRVWSEDAQPDGFPDAIVARFGRPVAVQERAVLRGEADVLNLGLAHETSDYRTLATRYAAQLHVNVLQTTTFLFVDNRRPPFGDQRVRRALNYAVDRREAARFSRPGGAVPTCQILPPGEPGYLPYCPYTLNPTKAGAWTAPDRLEARRLIAAAGVRGARVTVIGNSRRAELAHFAAKSLSELGFRVELRLVPPERFFPALTDPAARFQAGVVSWIQDFPSPSDFFQPLFACPRPSGSRVNIPRFCDPSVDAQIRAATRERDRIAANARWARIDRDLVERAVIVPLFNERRPVLVSRRVGNFEFHPQWNTLLDQLWVR